MSNSPERIWIGPRYNEARIFILGESWFGNWEGDLATDDGYIRAYLAEELEDRLYSCLADSCGADRSTFWNGVMFTNYVQRVGATRNSRPSKAQYIEAQQRLREILAQHRPHGVWIIGKEQGKYSAPVVQSAGVPVEVTAHPSSHRGERSVLRESLRASWQALLAKAARYTPAQ